MARLGHGAVGNGGHESQQRQDRREAREAAREAHAAKLTEAEKIAVLGQAIATAVTARGTVTMEDCRQAGISKPDAERLYDDAMAYAWRLDAAALTGAHP
jgi:hypothetical protein